MSKPTTGLAEYQAIVQGVHLGDEPPSLSLRREAALLALARRCNAQPRLAELLLDAGVLLMAVLEADLHAVAELNGQHTLSLTIRGSEDSGKLARPIVHRGPLDPVNSMAAQAIDTASPVMSENLAREPRFTDLNLRRAEAVSALMVPLIVGNRAYGALGVCQTRPRWFTDDDLRFTELMGQMLAAAMARGLLEEERRRDRAAIEAVLETIDDYVVHLDSEGKVLELNQPSQEVLGLSTSEQGGRPFWTTLAAPDESETVRDIFLSAVAERKPCEFESHILARDGILRQITWALQVVCDTAGKPRLVVLAGTDRTIQLRLEEDLEKARSVAEKATTALQELQTRIGEATSGITGRPAPAPTPPVAESLGSEVAPPGRSLSSHDQRSSPRRIYQYRQRIAPVVGKRLPSKWDFFEVQCRDISAGGISFFLDERPNFTNLVVILGTSPLQSCFGARVVRCVEARDPDGVMRYLVGCRFTGRIHM